MKRIRKMLAAVLGMAMLLGSMSVMAEGQPSKAGSSPTWDDVWAIETYVYDRIWRYDERGELSFYNNSDYPKADAMKYEKPGRRLADGDIASRYGAIDELYGNPPEGEDGTTSLAGDLKNKYSDLYDLGIDLVNSVDFATGESYNMDELWAMWDAFWQRTDLFFQKIENGTIYVVDDINGEEPPTNREWIKLSALQKFEQEISNIGEIGDNWDEPTRDQLKRQLDAFQAAIDEVSKPENGNFVFPGSTYSEPSSNVSKKKKSKKNNSKDTASIDTNVHEHQFEDVVIIEASALQDGQVGRQCVICGAIELGSVAPVSAYTAFIKDTMKAIEQASGAELTISTDRWVSFDKSVFDALAKKPELALTINYEYNHGKYTVTIPAGADLSALCNEEGFCGFRYLDAQFGGKALPQY